MTYEKVTTAIINASVVRQFGVMDENRKRTVYIDTVSDDSQSSARSAQY